HHRSPLFPYTTLFRSRNILLSHSPCIHYCLDRMSPGHSWVMLGFLAFASPAAISRAQISKGNLILITRGLQVQGMVTAGDVFHLNTCSDANYTSINWLWDSNPSLMGAAPGFSWSRWVRDETEVPARNGEAPYAN